MACADTIIVTGAGTAAVNGTYIRQSSLQFLKEGDSTYQLTLQGPFPGGEGYIPYVWRFSPNPYGGETYYIFSQLGYTGCPEDIPRASWTVGELGTGAKPILTPDGDTGFTFDPYSPWATLTETGRTRFLRLKVLGYI
jgi:hypothetical protein